MDRHFAGGGDGSCGGLEDGHQETEGIPLEGRCGNALPWRMLPLTDCIYTPCAPLLIQVAELVVATVSNVITSAEPESPTTQEIERNTTSAIVQSVESQVSLTLQEEGEVSIRQESIHVEAVSLDRSEVKNGLSFVSVQHSGQGSSPADASNSLAGTEIQRLNSSQVPEDVQVVASVRIPPSILDFIIPSTDGKISTHSQFNMTRYSKMRTINSTTYEVSFSHVAITCLVDAFRRLY